ncbi:hypothetical protein PFICI_10467 [Pestalotiopsis fici W106-1]|uniref:BZIP domain-containing protein n=1 Tax=Pestalotiopsis fici (strain W106-1 / CGMCC3.15140) TaxID=1229662 RepID=W3WX28_PESFW|nr:uncharacterized protein PFICI_10467 [Pestalotiopsis fici W106-1]ETS78405.1 hypothetical protein PFICI_10467 [Pestalotiopsis fici W106-1]
MPRKVRIPTSKEESRQAQQRSRARHRDYVASLEKRVAEFERQGVEATLEMQRAAQRVAATNERLLALLTLRGVPRHEVEAFLAAEPTAPDSASASVNVHSTALPASGMTHVQAPLENLTSPSTCRQSGQVKTCGEASDGRQQSCHDRRQVQQLCTPASKAISPMENDRETTSSAFPKEVTSCEAAATIIVNLRGNGEGLVEARQALGCSGDLPCSVKNTHLFQLMSEIP